MFGDDFNNFGFGDFDGNDFDYEQLEYNDFDFDGFDYNNFDYEQFGCDNFDYNQFVSNNFDYTQYGFNNTDYDWFVDQYGAVNDMNDYKYYGIPPMYIPLFLAMLHDREEEQIETTRTPEEEDKGAFGCLMCVVVIIMAGFFLYGFFN